MLCRSISEIVDLDWSVSASLNLSLRRRQRSGGWGGAAGPTGLPSVSAGRAEQQTASALTGSSRLDRLHPATAIRWQPLVPCRPAGLAGAGPAAEGQTGQPPRRTDRSVSLSSWVETQARRREAPGGGTGGDNGGSSVSFSSWVEVQPWRWESLAAAGEGVAVVANQSAQPACPTTQFSQLSALIGGTTRSPPSLPAADRGRPPASPLTGRLAGRK